MPSPDFERTKGHFTSISLALILFSPKMHALLQPHPAWLAEARTRQDGIFRFLPTADWHQRLSAPHKVVNNLELGLQQSLKPIFAHRLCPLCKQDQQN